MSAPIFPKRDTGKGGSGIERLIGPAGKALKNSQIVVMAKAAIALRNVVTIKHLHN